MNFFPRPFSPPTIYPFRVADLRRNPGLRCRLVPLWRSFSPSAVSSTSFFGIQVNRSRTSSFLDGVIHFLLCSRHPPSLLRTCGVSSFPSFTPPFLWEAGFSSNAGVDPQPGVRSPPLPRRGLLPSPFATPPPIFRGLDLPGNPFVPSVRSVMPLPIHPVLLSFSFQQVLPCFVPLSYLSFFFPVELQRIQVPVSR